ncbi:MAE1_2 [Sanghuangporus vaninii]
MQELKTNEFGSYGLLNVVRAVHPTVLIETLTVTGAFTEEVVCTMADAANEWTRGRTLITTGSPFPPAKMPHGKDYVIAECNNVLIYPGLGLGAIVSCTRTLSDEMIIAGAQRLAAQHSPQHSKIQMTRSCQISPMRRK